MYFLKTVFKKHKQHRHGFKWLILPSQCVADLSLGHKLQKKSRVISQTKYMYIYMQLYIRVILSAVLL